MDGHATALVKRINREEDDVGYIGYDFDLYVVDMQKSILRMYLVRSFLLTCL